MNPPIREDFLGRGFFPLRRSRSIPRGAGAGTPALIGVLDRAASAARSGTGPVLRTYPVAPRISEALDFPGPRIFGAPRLSDPATGPAAGTRGAGDGTPALIGEDFAFGLSSRGRHLAYQKQKKAGSVATCWRGKKPAVSHCRDWLSAPARGRSGKLRAAEALPAGSRQAP